MGYVLQSETCKVRWIWFKISPGIYWGLLEQVLEPPEQCGIRWSQGLGGAHLSGAVNWAGAGLLWGQPQGLSLPAHPPAASISRSESWNLFATPKKYYFCYSKKGNSHSGPGTTSCCWSTALPGSPEADLYLLRDGFLIGVFPSTP